MNSKLFFTICAFAIGIVIGSVMAPSEDDSGACNPLTLSNCTPNDIAALEDCGGFVEDNHEQSVCNPLTLRNCTPNDLAAMGVVPLEDNHEPDEEGAP